MPIFADKEPRPFESRCRIVDGRGIDVGFAERKAQFRQMGHLVHLSAGGLEQDGRTHATVDVAQRSRGIRIQRSGTGRRPREVGVNRRIETRLAQLAQNHGAKLGHVQRCRSQRNQRLGSRLGELPRVRPQEIHCASMASAPRVC